MKPVNTNQRIGTVVMFSMAIGVSVYVYAHNNEQERKLKASEVPKAALDALTKLADGAKIEEFEEEIEHGQKLYEAEWRGPTGKKEAVVTEQGDLIEIEELVLEAAVPQATVAAARKAAGQGVVIKYEKKTFVTYEAEFKKDGKEYELYISPAGHVHGQEEEDDDNGNDDDADED